MNIRAKDILYRELRGSEEVWICLLLRVRRDTLEMLVETRLQLGFSCYLHSLWHFVKA